MHYEIPAFQRPYVWNEDDQWAPLWDDLIRVADAYVVAKGVAPDAAVTAQHFLGAVVCQARPTTTGDVARFEVIDGQQRMTTLQILLEAVHGAIVDRGHPDMAESLRELVVNDSSRFRGTRERFKLWPSQADRTAFEAVMDPAAGLSVDHRISDAHAFFSAEAAKWLSGEPDEDGVVPPGDEAIRVEALTSALQDRLLVISIDLSGHDDSQLIFETLNDRGTPLLKADLIKNWVFRKGEDLGADVSGWAETQWAEFDTDWWRAEIRQGRLIRSRIDIFLQYWLTMRLRDEVKADDSFRTFVTYAEPLMSSAESAEAIIGEFRRDADTYRAFAQLDLTTAEGRFYRRVIERLELAATTPVFLWLLSENHAVPTGQRQVGLQALESWAIRRTLLRLTTKDVNKFAVAILKTLDTTTPDRCGHALADHLSEQTADTRVWPSDSRLAADLPGARLYGNIRQDRLRLVLGEVERYLRDQNPRYEAVSLPVGLEIEHIMPQGWRTYWDAEPKLDVEAAAGRDRLVNTLGNLTLITKALNGSLSNRPWTDTDATGLSEGGSPNEGKRTLLERFSLLVINKEILSDHLTSWTEQDIAQRSTEIVQALCQIWPGPLDATTDDLDSR